MRILFLSTWFPYPPDNGSKIRVYHLLRALARDHAVTLLSFAFATARPGQPGDLHSLCADVQVVPVDPFVANRAGILRTFVSGRPLASRPIPAMSQLVASALRSKAFDAIVASTDMMGHYALQAPPSIPKILEEHNSMTHWMWERYTEQTKPLQRARCWTSWQKQRLYEGRTYRQFDLITMVSGVDRAVTLATIGSERARVEVVPNGVDCRLNHPGPARPVPHRLVYNGALTYSANHDAMRYFLADIYPLIKRQVSEVSLTVTGSLSGVNIAGLAIDESVCLTGYVEDVRVPVAGAAVCVIPIRQGGGTRLKILEAMALGTPVVSTSKGAAGLEVKPGQDILLGDDPDEFAAQVVRLLRDGNLRAQLSANARRLVEQQYDWDQIGGRFVNLVEDVASRHGPKGISSS
jgi:glycosyltransferase involved in cell wall biosynthesis